MAAPPFKVLSFEVPCCAVIRGPWGQTSRPTFSSSVGLVVRMTKRSDTTPHYIKQNMRLEQKIIDKKCGIIPLNSIFFSLTHQKNPGFRSDSDEGTVRHVRHPLYTVVASPVVTKSQSQLDGHSDS